MSNNGETGSGSLPGPETNPQLSPVAVPQIQSASKPTVIGIYGIQGTGKTHLLGQLKQELEGNFTYHDGSAVIENVFPGDFGAFKNLGEQEKTQWREAAIEKIGKSADKGEVALVAGHFMLWNEGEEAGKVVWTDKDSQTYTHMLYLDVPADLVHQRREKDESRSREDESIEHLRNWQQAEKDQLRDKCRENNILFTVVSPKTPNLLPSVLPLLRDFQQHNEEHNLTQAKSKLDEVFLAGKGKLQTMLVFDADKTLAAEDTGASFWKVSDSLLSQSNENPLEDLFRGPLHYTYNAFRQATLLYEERTNDAEFEDICQQVASDVTMYPEFLSLLRIAASQEHVGAVVVTCGLRRVWEIVLERNGLSKAVKVIGGGRIADGFVVTAEVKAALVTRLQKTHRVYVWAFGDSQLDLGMLREADQAIVVVADEQTRSGSMETKLKDAINDGLQARQVVLPSNASPRLDTTKLPLVQLTEQSFIDSVLGRRTERAAIETIAATSKGAAKLLTTATRDARLSGPALREAHRRIGSYLATEFLTDIIGVEAIKIPHVQGEMTDGHRLLNEDKTTIVALMRGGEPMAFGVNDAFPLAMFVHAKDTDDVKPHHLEGQCTVVLVDSVINNGKTVVDFVKRARSLQPTIRIVVVTNVAQVKSMGNIACKLSSDESFTLVALRLSDNKYSGTRTVDTGNRLFNTIHLD